MRAKMLFLIEIVVIAAVFYLDYRGWLLFKTPYLFLLGWVSLRVRNLRWREVGLNGEQPFLKVLLIGLRWVPQWKRSSSSRLSRS